MDYVDGNAAAGLFAEALGIDASVLVMTCDGCGRSGRFADLHVYDRGPGVVARCPGCEEVTARVVRTPTEIWLDLRGSRSVRIPIT
ncbi:putative Zn finger protein [Kibdelosporangium banguiense]|uniref:Zn finger protein n=1 Tax=Kibdelosporangium banguiense TaxID=1365924 RepID=A0ABS4TTN2_9PSEU|nr:DUF6510 family protein [Kibdelosporangium banguiense]MBP2327733.1 putative Zn finger protein [Kibdelosporangium banguiense]